ncbi:MAG: SDR family oxidoreductase [Cohaesibacter sp.]|jgi:NAD(P)-dependent dehydrogenase (short-subunit alcohol dehydrogenase family)|nr:SDR family oxidoreductase [Cohaesibacter sp.]
MAQRSILITGCSTGIGHCCALGLKEEGWMVFATARRDEDLQDLASKGLIPLYLDYRDETSITKAVETLTEKTGGGLDALFNNGAYGQPGAVEDLPTSALREQFESNVFGWHELTRQVIPLMRQQGHGRIIQCSSVLGMAALPFRGAYNSSKFALEGLTDTLRLELHGSGIQVSLIEPGPITSRFRATAFKKLKEHIDMDRSVHAAKYQKRLARGVSDDKDRFELGPEAVLAKLNHALNAPKAKARYYVTVPTYFIGYAKRILSTTMLDRILRANGD